MIVGEAIQRIQSAYNKGMQSDDSRLSNRHVYSKLRSSRIRVISQQINKKQIVSQWCYQSIVVKMISAPLNECSDIKSSCMIMKSYKPLPQIFTSMDKHLIQSVTSSDGSIGFSQTYWDIIRYKNGRKYTQNLPEFYIKDGYLYITNRKMINFVIVAALFNDPIEAKKYSNECGNDTTSCISNLQYDFAIDGKLEEVVIELARDELVGIFSQLKEDRQNNARDDNGPSPRDQQQGKQQNQDE